MFRTYSAPPWNLVTTEDGDEKVVMDEGHEVFIGNIEDTCNICYSNAHLIEQAPIMYELLREIGGDIPLGGDFPERIDAIIKRIENG